MKRLRNYLLLALLTMVGNAYGDELKVADFTINAGETFELAVELENPDYKYIMTEFWMTLPDGVGIAKDEDGEFLYEESSRFDRTHSLTISKESEGNVYHFLIYSSKNKALKGTSGELFTITLEASTNATKGKYEGKIFNQVFSDENKNEHNPADVTFNVTIGPIKPSYAVSVTSSDETRGIVSISPESDGTYEEGTVVMVTATAKDGYHFVKWSDETTANPYSFSVSANVSLTAQFAPNQFTVTWKMENGQADIVQTLDYGSTITKPADPVKEGFTFKGWTPDVQATVPAENLVYTAQWERNKYTVKFVVDGQTAKEEELLFEATITKPVDPEKEGFTFKGWTPAVPEKMPAQDMTFTAEWTVNEYALIYIVNSQEWARDMVAYGETLQLRSYNAPNGYVFNGWIFTDGNDYQTMPAHDVTVTADITTGISSIAADGKTFDVYDLQGRKIRTQVTSLEGLPKGAYIINGRKVVK